MAIKLISILFNIVHVNTKLRPCDQRGLKLKLDENVFYSIKHFLYPLLFPFVRYKGPNHGYVGRFLGFSVYVSNTTIKEDGDQCFQDNQIYTKDTIPAVLTLNCTHHGRYVIYYNKRTLSSNPPDYSQFAYNELCEFEVYGELCLTKP